MTKPTPIAQPMEFTEAVVHCLRHYAIFRGTASRSEFWWWFLFGFLVGSGINIIDTTIFGKAIDDPSPFTSLTNLVLLLPGLAVGARRLHDINKSGWWQLLGLTIILIPLLFWWFARPRIVRGEGADTRIGKSGDAEMVETHRADSTTSELEEEN